MWHARGVSTPVGLMTRPSVRAGIWGSLRVLAAAAVVLVCYSLVPVTGETALAGWLVALLAVLVFTLVTIWQVRVVAGAKHPIYRAVEALVILVLLFLGLFALEYTALSTAASDAFTEPLDKFSGGYYAITVFSTVGFGDITPVSVAARTATMLQMLGNLIFFGAVVRVVSGVAKSSHVRQKGQFDSPVGIDAEQALSEGESGRPDPMSGVDSDR